MCLRPIVRGNGTGQIAVRNPREYETDQLMRTLERRHAVAGTKPRVRLRPSLRWRHATFPRGRASSEPRVAREYRSRNTETVYHL